MGQQPDSDRRSRQTADNIETGSCPEFLPGSGHVLFQFADRHRLVRRGKRLEQGSAQNWRYQRQCGGRYSGKTKPGKSAFETGDIKDTQQVAQLSSAIATEHIRLVGQEQGDRDETSRHCNDNRPECLVRCWSYFRDDDCLGHGRCPLTAPHGAGYKLLPRTVFAVPCPYVYKTPDPSYTPNLSPSEAH